MLLYIETNVGELQLVHCLLLDNLSLPLKFEGIQNIAIIIANYYACSMLSVCTMLYFRDMLASI